MKSSILTISMLLLGPSILLACAFCGPPTHDWTIDILGSKFGLMQYGNHTYILYGFNAYIVPFSAPKVAGTMVSGIIVVIASIAYFSRKKHSNRTAR